MPELEYTRATLAVGPKYGLRSDIDSRLSVLLPKLVRFVGLCAVYLPMLLLTYYIYINVFKVDVVFYSSIYAAFIAAIVCLLVLIYMPFFYIFSYFEKAQLFLMMLLLGYIFAISIPTVIDRSLSFYILEKLQQRGGGIRLDKFTYIFTNEFVREARLVDVRLTEQLKSGTITLDGNCVKLTPIGDRIASFGRFFRTHLLPKRRLLRGEYTDALIDPFKRSDSDPDYLCK